MNEVFYLPVQLDKTTLCYYNEVNKDDDFGYWTPAASFTPVSPTPNKNLEDTGDLPKGPCGGTCGGEHGEVPPSSGQHQKSLWMRWMATLLRLRRLRKKMLKEDMGCLQRLRHRLRRLKKVLYVCEGMSGSVGEAMAAARDRATRYQSVQQDTTLGYPYQVALPDGEERHYNLPSMKRLVTSDSQEAETTREYIKPPQNKTLFDVEDEGPHRSSSMGIFPTHEWGGVVHHGQNHRHSASLDARPSPHPAVSGASSSSSSSSSWAGWGSGDESSRGSPRRVRKTGVGFGHRGSQLLANCMAQITSPKNERAPRSPQDGGRRAGRQQQGVGLGAGTLLPSYDPYCTTASTLADIDMVPVPSGSSPNYPSGSGTSQGTLVGSSLGVQGSSLPLSYEQSSTQSGCSASADHHDLPPLYSEVIGNPTLYRSVSRPSEQRTNSGKI